MGCGSAQRRRAAATTAAVAGACLIAVVATGASTASVAVDVRVVHCPTSYGVTIAPKHPSIPSSVPVTAAASTLTAYSNGWMTVLAPRGWHCAGAVGVDGNEGLTVLPRYVSKVSSAAAAITATHEWNGVAVWTACPFFPELGRGSVFACKLPGRELIYRISAHVVAFEDPPGVNGTGDPSGGAVPANGVVAYVGTPSSSSFSVGSATCTLPQSQHRVCTAVLNDFLARWNR